MQFREPLVKIELESGIAFITLCRPPVNALGLDLRRALRSALEHAAGNSEVLAVIVLGSRRGFSAGGDKREICSGEAVAAPRLTLDLHPLLEQMHKPVVAAVHGYALGGGLETVLACHFRVACADAEVGLPEITAGIVPLSGTQRLPRLLRMAEAVQVILSGRKRPAREFAHTALFDRLVGAGDMHELRAAAIDLARTAMAHGPPYPLVRHLPIVDASADAVLRRSRRELPESVDRYLRYAALDALTAAVQSRSFDEGMGIATSICDGVLAGVGSARCGIQD
ncbi:MAG TPA: enoyl-CoA hydratase/isomerase family protein [Steroidobacteraceae bacterium]